MKLDQDKQLKLDFEGDSLGLDRASEGNTRILRLVHSNHLQTRIFNSVAMSSSNFKHDEKLFDGVLRHAKSLSW